MRIAVAPNYSETEVRAELQHELYQKLHPDEFAIKIDVVKHVKRTERGKIGILKQKFGLQQNISMPSGIHAQTLVLVDCCNIEVFY